ncbi:hypothetical protein LCGC14_0525730 [marine sediment metagenome]|uniref:Uncharacterized protein n=1 Tax=marine sediment metagenome TaxID=412755 RepID=A0A0F9RX98_9ZZZZ|nr:hypothetical protein [bacterium]
MSNSVSNEFNFNFSAQFADSRKLLKIDVSNIGNLLNLIGRNRTGKSTTLRAIAYLLGFKPIRLENEINIELTEQFKNIKNNLIMNLEITFPGDKFKFSYEPVDKLILEHKGGLISDPNQINEIVQHYFDIYYIDRSSRSIIEITKVLLSTIERWMTYFQQEADDLYSSFQNLTAEYSDILTNNDEIGRLTVEHKDLMKDLKKLEKKCSDLKKDRKVLEQLIHLIQLNENVKKENQLMEDLRILAKKKKNYEDELSSIQKEEFETEGDLGTTIISSQIEVKEKLIKRKEKDLLKITKKLNDLKEQVKEDESLLTAIKNNNSSVLLDYKEKIEGRLEILQNEMLKCMKSILLKLDRALKSNATCKKHFEERIPGFNFFCFECNKEFEQTFSDLNGMVQNSLHLINSQEEENILKEKRIQEELKRIKDVITTLEDIDELQKLITTEAKIIEEFKDRRKDHSEKQNFMKSKNREFIEKLRARIESTIKKTTLLDEKLIEIENVKKDHPDIQKEITDFEKKLKLKAENMKITREREKFDKLEKESHRKREEIKVETATKNTSIKNLKSQNEKNKQKLGKKGFTIKKIEEYRPFFKYWGELYNKVSSFREFLKWTIQIDLENNVSAQKKMDELLRYKDQVVEVQSEKQEIQKSRKRKVKIDQERLERSRLFNIFKEELDSFFNLILKEEVGKGWEELEWGKILHVDWRKKIIKFEDYKTNEVIDLDFFQFSGGEDIISSIAAAFSRPVRKGCFRVLLIDEIGELDKNNRKKLINLLKNKIMSKDLGFAILVEPTEDPIVKLEVL